MYTAPASAGTYHLIATSVEDPKLSATALITAKPAGVWIDVTPSEVSMDPNFSATDRNYGAQQVVADPVNPGTFYLTVTYQGVWRSLDFGATWTRLTAGDQGMDNGRPAMEIAPDGSYILSTLLYPINDFSNGCWKSEAGDLELGRVWRRIEVPGVPAGDDMNQYEIDPLQRAHVVAIPHTPTGYFYESLDAGETWTPVPVSSAGSPARLHLIDSSTVLAIYDWGSGKNPQLGRKSNRTWSWTETSTKDEAGNKVAGQTAFHADQQIYVDSVHRLIYTGGPEGVHRSSDSGLTWTKLSTPADASEGLVATDTKLYSMASYAFNSKPFAPRFMIGPRDPDAKGSDWTAPATPEKLTNGWLKAGVAKNGRHFVIVAGMWNAGIWIYIEP
jgi:hypothetical protein